MNSALISYQLEKAALEDVLAAPETYRDRADEVGELTKQLAELEQKVVESYDRWEALSLRDEDADGG